MKNKILIIATLAGSLVLSSCEDFLTHDNTTSANQETFFDTDEALEAATAPLYNYVWNSFNDKAYYSMRSEEHTSELQSQIAISYAVFC